MSSRPLLAILDYGMGNLRSAEKALRRVGADTVVTRDHGEIASADGVILPGVGAFPPAMARIRELELDQALQRAADRDTPVLGICLGLQLLFEHSDENGGAEGLGLLDGPVVAIPAGGRKVPHIGWAPVNWAKSDPLVAGLRPGEPFYFVHSYVCQPEVSEVLGTANYGGDFACVAVKGRTWGVQFHPEKSSAAGMRLLQNFTAICAGQELSTGDPSIEARGSR